jgi:hypothetical protein
MATLALVLAVVVRTAKNRHDRDVTSAPVPAPASTHKAACGAAPDLSKLDAVVQQQLRR